jgi:hypothetical protein
VDYAVASHIYTCATEAGVVVLDAHHGKYSIIPIDRARTLEGMVQGWPTFTMLEALPGTPTGSPYSLLNSLIQGGMVTPMADLRLGMQKRAVGFVAQEAILDALAARDTPEIHWRQVMMFSLSVLYATFMLKRRSFEALLHNLQRRKDCHTRAVAQCSVAQIREHVRVFSWLRPFAYAESDACLFDSVVLTDFLFRQGIVADFLVGVRIRPFAAHSWVQAQGFALNDLPEYLAAYTPILSI